MNQYMDKITYKGATFSDSNVEMKKYIIDNPEKSFIEFAAENPKYKKMKRYIYDSTKTTFKKKGFIDFSSPSVKREGSFKSYSLQVICQIPFEKISDEIKSEQNPKQLENIVNLLIKIVPEIADSIGIKTEVGVLDINGKKMIEIRRLNKRRF